MTEKELAQYKSLKKEIPDLQKRIEKDKELLDALRSEQVTDSVTCGRKGKKPLRTVKITGTPYSDIDKRIIIIEGRIKSMENHITKLFELETAIEEYLQNVSDSLTRMAIRYRYIDQLSYTKVAMKLGGRNTADSVRMMLNRYFEIK